MTTLLVAEPQPAARLAWKRKFEAAGFTVFTAGPEDDLEHCLSEANPDALVADRRMVGPGGELLREVREASQRGPTPCFVLASAASGPDRLGLLKAGADWYIDKAALVSSLPSAVRFALEGRAPRATPPPHGGPRARVALAVEYLHAGRMASGETLNISLGGMFIKCPGPVDPRGLLLLQFSLPGHQRWECFARVAWQRRAADQHPYPAGMAVEFLDLEPHARTALADFVAGSIAPLALPV